MTDIEIEYCAPCQMRGHALDIAESVLAAVEDDIDHVELTPAHDGVIIVRVDGEQVFHSGEDDYDADRFAEQIAEQVGAALQE